MFSCDYNGWADVPEEEREAIDAFEATKGVPKVPVYVPVIISRRPRVRSAAARLAA